MRSTSGWIWCVGLAMVGCGDEKGLPIGGTCGDDDQCAAGLCSDAVCLDPAGDEDGDGLTNAIERALGTNIRSADTDGDGKLDAAEVGDPMNPTDTDGDGKIDAIESAILDADGDCVVDELDPADDDPTIPGFACELECNGVLEVGEACDDGNDDPLDGCDECVVAPLVVNRTEREPRQGVVGGLTSGGLVATWHEGRLVETPGEAGHSVAFFDANGVEIRRHEDIAPPTSQASFLSSVAALRGGDVVVGTWFYKDELSRFVYHVRRYTDLGAPVGDVLEVDPGAISRPRFELVPADAGAYAVVYVAPGSPPELVIRYVDTAGNLSPVVRGRPLRGTEFLNHQALGFGDGSVVVVSREPDARGVLTLLTKRFGSEGTQVGDDLPVLPEGMSEIVFNVAASGNDGYAVFFMSPGGASGEALGYQRLDASDHRVGEPVMLVDDAPRDCLNGLSGGFHVGGEAFIAIENRCDNTLLGWQEGPNGAVPLAIAAPSQLGDLYTLKSAPFAGGVAFLYLHTPRAGFQAVYLTRFNRQGERALMTR